MRLARVFVEPVNCRSPNQIDRSVGKVPTSRVDPVGFRSAQFTRVVSNVTRKMISRVCTGWETTCILIVFQNILMCCVGEHHRIPFADPPKEKKRSSWYHLCIWIFFPFKCADPTVATQHTPGPILSAQKEKDVAGAKIRTLLSPSIDPSRHHVRWCG